MKLRNLWMLCLTIMVAAILSSCSKKEGCMDTASDNYDPDAKVPCDNCCEYSNENFDKYIRLDIPGEHAFLSGVLSGVITTGSNGSVKKSTGYAVAEFVDAGGNLLNAGTVDVDGNVLTRDANNQYYYQITASQPIGIGFPFKSTWTATGADYPAMSGYTHLGFSEVENISSGDVISGNNYTLKTSDIVDSDSVYFTLYGPNGTVIRKAKNGDESSQEFSAAETGSLGKGKGFIQIVGVRFMDDDINGKKVWFVNQWLETKEVTFK